jgi:Flp pilus assembly protein TadD/predicted aspartyl protease
MHSGRRLIAIGAVLAAVSCAIVIHADVTPSSQAAEVQMQLGRQLMDEGRYIEALQAFQNAMNAPVPADPRTARTGVVQAALRVAEFNLARATADDLARMAPKDPDVTALHADALWASGLFEEAEARYEDALAMAPDLARARHGLARSLAARSRLDRALDEAQAALRLAPRDLEIHHTVGFIFERMNRYEEAAGAFTNYLNLLPNKDTSEKATWSRSEIKFLRSFGQRTPYELAPGDEDRSFTVPFRVENDKVVVRARVNDSAPRDFVVDTGAENTMLSGPTARRLGVTPVAYTLTAGVGGLGLRGLQLARINSLEIGDLKLRNVAATIRDPPLRDLPVNETDSISPLAFGFSMIVDYGTRTLTMARRLPDETADFELPLRMHRLAMVRGTVEGTLPANFVVDTGGQVLSISHATASALNRPMPERRIALKVFGSSGWDEDAFLLPNVDLRFDAIRYENFPVVVMNLQMPSALLGVQLGGTVGHRFLSRYRVTIDLDRSVLRLTSIS